MATDPGVILTVQLPPEQVAQLESRSRWPVDRRNDPAGLGEHLAGAPLAVVLGPDVVDPIASCRQIRRHDPHVPVLVLPAEDRSAELASTMQVAPFIGRDTYCLSTQRGDEDWVVAVLAAAEGEARRRAHGEVIERIRSGPQLMPPPPAVSQYLGQLLEHAPIGVVTLDDAGFVRGWNPRATSIFGRRPAESIGSPLLALFPDAEHHRLLDAWGAAVGSDDGVTVVCSRTAPAGTPQHLELVLASIDPDLPSRGCLVLVHDVTDEQQNRQALTIRAREAELRAEVAMALTAAGPLAAKAERTVDALVRHTEALTAQLWLWDAGEDRLVLEAEAGSTGRPPGTRPGPDDEVRLVGETRRPRRSTAGALAHTAGGADAPRVFVGHPLVVEDELLGVLALYGDERLHDLAEWGFGPVADPVAMAIARDRAEERVRELLIREHEARRRAELSAEQHATLARTLQRSLLPPQLPQIAAFEVAAEYHWAGDGSVIGGDFYDVFPLADGRWCAAIGDVTGKGAEAAALTSMARHTLRTAALSAHCTGALLATLNDALLTAGAGRRLCTVALLAMSPRGEVADVEVNLAGHPAPFLLQDGHLVAVDAPHNPLVGVFPAPTYRHHVITVRPGDILVLHTDGVTEVREPNGEIGDRVVLEFLDSGPWATGAELVASLAQTVIDHQGGHLRDDVALLSVRYRGAS